MADDVTAALDVKTPPKRSDDENLCAFDDHDSYILLTVRRQDLRTWRCSRQ
jgi:hypothetical protein